MKRLLSKTELQTYIDLTNIKLEILKLQSDSLNWQHNTPNHTRGKLESVLMEVETQLQLQFENTKYEELKKSDSKSLRNNLKNDDLVTILIGPHKGDTARVVGVDDEYYSINAACIRVCLPNGIGLYAPSELKKV